MKRVSPVWQIPEQQEKGGRTVYKHPPAFTRAGPKVILNVCWSFNLIGEADELNMRAIKSGQALAFLWCYRKYPDASNPSSVETNAANPVWPRDGFDRWGRGVPYALAGQHLGGATTTNPNSKEDHEQSGGKHHLTGVGRRVPDGQGKGHRASQSWRAQHGESYTSTSMQVPK